MSDCKNCKHLVMYDYKNKSYSCELGECEFEPEEQEPTTKNDLGVEHHKQNIKAYAHDFGVSEEQAESELRVTTKNDLGVDCISRERVLKLIYDYKENHSNDREHYPINYGTLLDMIRWVRALPSVTPQLSSELEKNSKKLEKDFGELDCISRADAIRVASGYCHPSNVAKELAKLPSVTPQEPILDKITEIIEPLRHLSIDEMSDIEWQILRVIDKYKAESEGKE